MRPKSVDNIDKIIIRLIKYVSQENYRNNIIPCLNTIIIKIGRTLHFLNTYKKLLTEPK